MNEQLGSRMGSQPLIHKGGSMTTPRPKPNGYFDAPFGSFRKAAQMAWDPDYKAGKYYLESVRQRIRWRLDNYWLDLKFKGDRNYTGQ